MNAPAYINNAHKALSRNPGGLTLEELAGKLRTKVLKVSPQIRALHDAGLIETVEDAGQPVYKLKAAPAAESGRADIPPPQYDPASVAFPPSVVTRDPHTGMPRNLLDIESDPAGLLIVKDGEPLKAYQAEERILTPEAQADRDAFIAEYGRDGNCSCHISPPCNSCLHPGNPLQQDEVESCWMAAGDSEGGETDAPAADADKWIPFDATADSVCPVPAGTRVRYWLEDGESGVCLAERLSWRDSGDGMFYPIVAYKIIQQAQADFATTPELQYLTPEDYEMPPADPVLLASANRMLCDRLESIAEALRASTIPSLKGIAGAEDLAPHVKTLCDALAAAESTTTARGHTINQLRLEVADLRERLDAQIEQWQADTGRLTADLQASMESRSHAINEAARLRAELATERQAREALQEQSDAVDVKDAAVSYLVRVPKRAPILRRKPESARDAALSAVRAGAKRADVLAVVPVGTARRGAEWQSTEAGG